MSVPSGSNAVSSFQYQPSFIQGLVVARASATTLTVSAGACLDSTGVSNIPLDEAVTINCANTGINGMDTGVLVLNTTYYVHAVSNSLNKAMQGAIVSLSRTAPLLPDGYDSFRMIDYQITDGSANLLLNINTGSFNQRTKHWDAAISVLAGGAATTLTAISLAGACPAGMNGVSVDLQVAFTPNVAGNSVGFTPFGSVATSIKRLSGSVSTVAQSALIPDVLSVLDSGVPKILYINSAATGATTALVASVHFEI